MGIHNRKAPPLRSAKLLASTVAISALLLTGCGGNDNSGGGDKNGGGSQEAAFTPWFQDAVQGTWSCSRTNHYGNATVDMFTDTDKMATTINDNVKITVEGNNWKAADGKYVDTSGTFSVSGSTLTVEMGPLKQVIQGMPESEEEARNKKAVLVEGADPENRLSISMPSATKIDFVDAEEYSTQCLKY